MTWTEHAYRQFKDQERTDYAVMQQQYAEQNNQRNREINMSKHRTARGDRVPKFPDVSDRDDRIAEVRSLMAEAYDAAEAEQNRRTRMESASKPDLARFPALGNGAQ